MSDSDSVRSFPTPWQVWLHPVRTCRRIGELRESVRAAEAARQEAADIAVRQASDNVKAIEEYAEKRAELGEQLRQVESQIEQLRRENERQKQKLEEYGDVEATIAEFELRIENFEDVRKGYELRIRTLRKQLDDANKRLRERGAASVKDPGPINMTSKRRREPKDPSTWFRTLPDDI